MEEMQLLKPISFNSRSMVWTEIFLGLSLNLLVSCWTLFRRFAFTNRFRERPSRVFRILALPLLPLNDCTSPSFFRWAIVLAQSYKSYEHHLRHFSGGFPSLLQTYNLSFVKDRGSFCKLFPNVIVHACCYGVAVLNTSEAERNYCYHILFLQICYEETCKKKLHYTYILPGCDKWINMLYMFSDLLLIRSLCGEQINMLYTALMYIRTKLGRYRPDHSFL